MNIKILSSFIKTYFLFNILFLLFILNPTTASSGGLSPDAHVRLSISQIPLVRPLYFLISTELDSRNVVMIVSVAPNLNKEHGDLYLLYSDKVKDNKLVAFKGTGSPHSFNDEFIELKELKRNPDFVSAASKVLDFHLENDLHDSIDDTSIVIMPELTAAQTGFLPGFSFSNDSLGNLNLMLLHHSQYHRGEKILVKTLRIGPNASHLDGESKFSVLSVENGFISREASPIYYSYSCESVLSKPTDETNLNVWRWNGKSWIKLNWL